MRQPHLKHQHIVKLGRLLNMLYKPAELAEEIGVTQDTIYRSYLPAGLPHTRDDQGNVWIHGPAFVSWARETISRRQNKRAGLPIIQTKAQHSPVFGNRLQFQKVTDNFFAHPTQV